MTVARFHAAQERTGPLTMGQANMVRCVRTDPPEHMNYRVVRPLPPETTLTGLAEAAGLLLSRHESLRTLVREDTQHVLASGELPVPVRDSATPEESAEELARELQGARFELVSEVPFRIAAVTSGGVPSQVVLVTTHSAVDAIGLAVLLADWDALILGKPLPPVTAPQPVDVAAAENGTASRRRAEAALRYWETHLRRIPRSTLTVSVDDTDTEWLLPRLRVRSVAAAAALRRITVRTGVSASAAVLAALATVTGLRAGAVTVPILSISANRFRPELRDYVGPLAQDALVPVEIGADTFDAVLRGVRSATLAAYQNSRFDADALIRVMTDVQRERGVFFARDIVFNDMSVPGQGGRVARTDAGVHTTWLPEATLPTRMSLWVNRLEGELDFTLWADPRVLPRPDAQAAGEGLARLLIDAGTRDVPLADLAVEPVPRGPGWVRSDGCWTDLAEVRNLLPPGSEVVAVPDEELGWRLVAYTVGQADRTPEDLHRACLAALPGRMSAMTPHHYVVCATAPRPGERWEDQARLAEGSGR
ncbi:hypothetical protein Aph01nite_62960 [Acrocarpospora phusangensis]|uniref:Condensation domain-containing protein n=1 Tax=Acrocarpospora phusangensis TaxID=1070424 RepID=A0A919QFN8_9ACTN|nr:condensation domain-containing protein [Acrocarpospora phusangensis]GIH27986.1 hypothetical protein Aph01nite_62960 [Acrocarpospora phusangensis]